MISQIKALEKISRLLEPASAERKEVRDKVISYSENFLDEIAHAKTYIAPQENQTLFNSPISEEPIAIEEVINLIKENVDTPGLNPASGNYLGYIPGGGLYYSALGDYLVDIANRYAGYFFAAPGAVQMENMLLNWMSELAGYPAYSAGNLTSGGSIANLIAIVTARDASNVQAKDYDKMVVYLSEQTHHCLDKALNIAGLKECIKRTVPLNAQFQMRPEALEQMVVEDKKNGLKPWLIVASAGTTDTGVVDPLEQIGAIAKKEQLWFHVDAAYGGFFLLTKEGKKILKGIELSDSLVMDPHKGLFLPYGTGVVLVKEKNKLLQSHAYQANYLQDISISEDDLSPANLSPELTKHFRGMRLWLPLKLFGLKLFKAALEEKLLLAKYFEQEIKKIDGFEIISTAELSIVTYRYLPKQGDANLFNQQLVQEIQKDGRVFISSTVINGKFTLRMAILSFRTHLENIDLALAVLKEKVVSWQM